MKEQTKASLTYKKKLPSLLKFAIAIATLAITAPVVYSIWFNHTIDISLSTLTLKKESCDLLQQERIAVKRNSAADSICSVSAEFRANDSGNGGVIYMGERKIHIADNQVVATELTDVNAEIDTRIHTLVLLLLCLGFMLGTQLWLARN